MILFYETKVKEYLDSYKRQKKIEQKGLEQDKLEKQLKTLEQESQIKDWSKKIGERKIGAGVEKRKK
jgi:hypothetical protein